MLLLSFADIVRAELPNFIPPSYRGSTVRYLYYVRSTLCGRWMELENGHSHRESKRDLIQLVSFLSAQYHLRQSVSVVEIVRLSNHLCDLKEGLLLVVLFETLVWGFFLSKKFSYLVWSLFWFCHCYFACFFFHFTFYLVLSSFAIIFQKKGIFAIIFTILVLPYITTSLQLLILMVSCLKIMEVCWLLFL